jgi:hypothetical protein
MKKRRASHTCPHCHKKLLKDTNYCQHCGKRTRAVHEKAHTCPSCKRTIHLGDVYCKHCGLHFSRHRKKHHSLFLAHIVVFLVLLLALFLLFSLPQGEQGDFVGEEIVQETATIALSSLHCNDVGTGFEVCGDVSWVGGAYAKSHIPGGENLADAEKHVEPYTYCQRVSYKEGFRVFRAFVYDLHGDVLAERGEGLECVKKPRVIPPPVSTTYEYTTPFGFYAKGDFTKRPDGTGSVVIPLPDPFISCTLDGSFEVDDGGKKTGTKSFKIKQYCDGATGIFAGSFDATQQLSVVDSGFFAWNDEYQFDPAPTQHDAAIFFYTCDGQYLYGPRYYVSVNARGFGTSTLVLDWEYFNDDTTPRVYLKGDLTCLLRGPP